VKQGLAKPAAGLRIELELRCTGLRSTNAQGQIEARRNCQALRGAQQLSKTSA